TCSSGAQPGTFRWDGLVVTIQVSGRVIINDVHSGQGGISREAKTTMGSMSTSRGAANIRNAVANHSQRAGVGCGKGIWDVRVRFAYKARAVDAVLSDNQHPKVVCIRVGGDTYCLVQIHG